MITATCICDSINPSGNRITTIQATVPKWLLAQINTHGLIAKNAGSSRAIPLAKMREKATYTPEKWWRNGKGMSPSTEIERCLLLDGLWDEANELMQDIHQDYQVLGVHKQQANRLLEPFLWIDVLMTGTDWNGFMNQRLHGDAQDEMQNLARCVGRILVDHEPVEVRWQEWHVPYEDPFIKTARMKGYNDHLYSAARCARISYAAFDGKTDWLQDEKMAREKLMNPSNPHWSPFQHPAMALPGQHGRFTGWYELRKFYDITPQTDEWKERL